MRLISSALTLLFFGIGFLPRSEGQAVMSSGNPCYQHNIPIKKMLPRDNALLRALDEDRSGDGVLLPWMTLMQKSNIRHATADVYFESSDHLLHLSMEKIDFFNRYYDYSSRNRITGTFAEHGLQDLVQKLKFPFFLAAMNLLQQVQLDQKACGHLYLSLLDDPCLPTLNEMPQIQLKCQSADRTELSSRPSNR